MLSCYQGITKQLLHAVIWGPWVLYTLGCTKRHGPRHSVQQLYSVYTLKSAAHSRALHSLVIHAEFGSKQSDEFEPNSS